VGEDLGARRRQLHVGHRIVILEPEKLGRGIWRLCFVLFLTIAGLTLIGWALQRVI
jgi:hypothetical protein